MNSRMKGIAFMAATMFAMSSEVLGENRPTLKIKEATPDHKRKKCKSCKNINSCHGVYKNPNKTACETYTKKK